MWVSSLALPMPVIFPQTSSSTAAPSEAEIPSFPPPLGPTTTLRLPGCGILKRPARESAACSGLLSVAVAACVADVGRVRGKEAAAAGGDEDLVAARPPNRGAPSSRPAESTRRGRTSKLALLTLPPQPVGRPAAPLRRRGHRRSRSGTAGWVVAAASLRVRNDVLLPGDPADRR